jgi:sulfide dehydrogenase [flavocytochrome c] flavoprotein subunit
MSNISRRHFLSITAGAAALTTYAPIYAQTAFKAKVVIIGGGAGGTIAAKYLRKADPTIEVTLIEQNKFYHTCFMSNEVISGERRINSITFNYDSLHKNGIKVIYSRAIEIDPITKKVSLQGGEKIAYDRLIISPGIDFKWNAIEGYDESVIDKMPHAWKAGEQTIILRKQLESMKDGGTVLISVPRHPSRCPVAPYERASQIALYLKQHKPKSKVLIFDAKSAFPKQQLFIQAWQKLYGFGTDNSLIEWIPAHEEGSVIGVDADNMAVYAGEFEDEHTAEVINIIPPQVAGKIAKDSDLVDESGWCPVNQKTFESSLQKDIYVIGDACVTLMPKAAQSSSTQAQICAQAIVSALQGSDINEIANKSHLTTCYTIIGRDYGIPVAAVYRLKGDIIQAVKDKKGESLLNNSAENRKREVANAYRWYKKITKEMFDES